MSWPQSEICDVWFQPWHNLSRKQQRQIMNHYRWALEKVDVKEFLWTHVRATPGKRQRNSWYGRKHQYDTPPLYKGTQSLASQIFERDEQS